MCSSDRQQHSLSIFEAPTMCRVPWRGDFHVPSVSLQPTSVVQPPKAGCERFREGVQGRGSGSLACHGEIAALPNLHFLANSVFVGSWFCFFPVIILFHLLMKNITFGNWLMLKHILLHSNNILCLPEFTASYFAVHYHIKTHSVW